MSVSAATLMSVSASTARNFRTPDCKPAHFQTTNINNKDVVCLKCGTHQHRPYYLSKEQKKKCQFCGEDLNLKRGRRPRTLVYVEENYDKI